MNALDILDNVETISGKKSKTSVLKSGISNLELKALLHAALNFNLKFNIKKFNIPESVADIKNHDDFMSLLAKLESRELTGNSAISAVEDFLSNCGKQKQKWYSRIIRKDLKAGFDISTANSAGFDIPKFDVMLAKDGNQCKNIDKIVKKGVYCSPKLDGYRCIAICSHGSVTLHSRNGTEYGNFPSIIATLEKWCENSSFVLDGEIMSDNFNAMQQSAFASKRGTTVGDVKFHVFGYVPLEEWKSGNFKQLTSHRLANLNALAKKNEDNNPGNIVVILHELVYTVENISILQTVYESNGYEGVMVLPNIPYFIGRKSNKLMKFKSMLSQDCKVIGFYEGTGKYKDSLGGIHLLQEDGLTKCDVGSGFTDADRKYIWNNQDSFLNKIAEIKFQELTSDKVMRFPIFLRWRNDK